MTNEERIAFMKQVREQHAARMKEPVPQRRVEREPPIENPLVRYQREAEEELAIRAAHETIRRNEQIIRKQEAALVRAQAAETTPSRDEVSTPDDDEDPVLPVLTSLLNALSRLEDRLLAVEKQVADNNKSSGAVTYLPPRPGLRRRA